MIGVREVAGSNPVVPTISQTLTAASFGSRSAVVADGFIHNVHGLFAGMTAAFTIIGLH